MLTAFQVSTAAHQTEDGELYCDDCADDRFTRPVSHDDLDQWQTESNRSEDASEWCEYAAEWVDLKGPDWDGEVPFGCERAVYCEGCGTELVEEWHDHPTDLPSNRPAARWTPCSMCGAGDGEVHRDDCPSLVRPGWTTETQGVSFEPDKGWLDCGPLKSDHDLTGEPDSAGWVKCSRCPSRYAYMTVPRGTEREV